MSTQLSMFDTMFLELEQFDQSAHIYIGAADRMAAPDVAVLADGIRRSFAELDAPAPKRTRRRTVSAHGRTRSAH